MTDYLAQLRDGIPFEKVLSNLADDLPFKVEPDTRPKATTIAEIWLRAEAAEAIPLGPLDEAQDGFAVAVDEGLITEAQFDTAFDLMMKLDVQEQDD